VSTEPICNVSNQDLLFHARPDADEAQLEGQNYRVTVPWRPISGVAFYTLTALVGSNFTQKSWAAPVIDGEQSSPIQSVGDRIDTTVQVEQAAQDAVAAPESFNQQEFAPEAMGLSESPSTPLPVASRDTPVSSTNTSLEELENKSIQSQAPIPNPQSPIQTSSGTAPQLIATSLQENRAQNLPDIASPEQIASLPESRSICLAQNTASSGRTLCPEVEGLQQELRNLEDVEIDNKIQASPALSISIPSGFGLDNNTGFISATYQQRTRYGNVSDGGVGVGIGVGDARKAVGAELSYTSASFGGSRDFGSGGFNVKLHRQLADDVSVAAGWNGAVNLGGGNDFENSLYGAVTKIFRTREDINSLFSRVAVTAGVGNGQFRSEKAVAEGTGGVNAFGNVAVRVAEPVSLIAEWSGQDLGVGASIAPFKNIPLVITPAVRDIVGAGDGPRFVLGTGMAFKF
jgi:hypothetical protein